MRLISLFVLCSAIGIAAVVLTHDAATIGQLPERSDCMDQSAEIADLHAEIADRDALIKDMADQIAELKKAKATPAPTPKPTPKAATPTKPYSVDPVPGHWTYAGNISDHLRTTHGQKIDGLSIEQQLILHDSLHEATTKIAPAPKATLNCPTGTCPTSQAPQQQTRTYYYAPRLFRR